MLALALPFAIVTGSYQAAMLFPGSVRLAEWEWFASAVFLLALVPVLLVLRQPRFTSGRIASGILVSLLFIYAALLMHIHATCEYIAPFIGGTAPTEIPKPEEQSQRVTTTTHEGGC